MPRYHEVTKGVFNEMLMVLTPYKEELRRYCTSDDLHLTVYKLVYDTWYIVSVVLVDVESNIKVKARLEELSSLEDLVDEGYKPTRRLNWSEIQLLHMVVDLYDSYEWRRKHLYRTTTFFDSQFSNNTELARRLGDMGFDMSWFSVLVFVYFYNEKVNEAKKEVNVG